MMGKEPSQLRLEQVVREMDPQVILKFAAPCDGHSIWVPDALVRLGLNPELVRAFDRLHMASATNPKWGFEGPSGAQVEACKGVYGLELLDFICEAFGIPSAPKSGRGAIARWDSEQLRRKLGTSDEAP